MSSIEEIRKTVTESRPVRAAVGATDLAVERAKDAWGKAASPEAKDQAKERLTQAQKSIGEAVTKFDPKAFRTKVTESLDPKALQDTASRIPGWAVSGVIQVAGKAEAQYESLAERGKEILGRVKNDPHAQDLMDQGKQVVDRTKTAVVTVRSKVDDRTASARSAVSRGRDAAAARVPRPSAPADPADDAGAPTTPVAEPPAEKAESDAPQTPVATPPKKAASPRKKSPAATTARTRKAPAKRPAASAKSSTKGSAKSSAKAADPAPEAQNEATSTPPSDDSSQ